MNNLTTLNAELVTCRRCPRLTAWREQIAREKRKAYRDQNYWGKPVPGFGDPQAKVMVVGLAPGAHGSNRTGRMFTGDASGDFLYPALYRAGFASQPHSHTREDGLTLHGLYITAAVRCAPPGNRPLPAELASCQPYLAAELDCIRPKVIVALGRIAFDSILQICLVKKSAWTFAHGAHYRFSPENSSPNTPSWLLETEHWLISSYHPSQQNTLTGRLTQAMFDEIWTAARQLARTDGSATSSAPLSASSASP
ncbi:MAG: uracil-DNA glycosylase [Anaerolineales bacterium]|nr:uracil-DNA glycosylase [Anaerolineales bacterium]MCX7755741.1 uracil-DNA glycosylase [Anaerolineales bacterium]MDW8277659.1 uracil-DNA glycosylase [Anaerolineales bacterium]